MVLRPVIARPSNEAALALTRLVPSSGETNRLLATLSRALAALAGRGLSCLLPRVRDPRQVRRPWIGIQLPQNPVVVRLLRGQRHLRLRIVQVAEHDRLGRAGLLASGDDLVTADLAVLRLGV